MASSSGATFGAGLLFPVLASVAACNAIWGVDELSFEPTTSSTGASAAGGSGAAMPGGGGMGAGGTSGGAAGAGGAGATGGAGPVPCEGDAGEALCVAVPNGWTGPVAAFLGDPDEAPICPTGSATVVMLFGGLAADASCTSCSCSASCEYSDITSFTGSDLCIGIAQAAGPQSGSCMNLQAAAYPLSVIIDPPEQSCQSSGGGFVTQNPRWTSVGLLCGAVAAGGSCTEGTCVEQGADPFRPGVCVWRTGDVACPNGFPSRSLLSTDESYADTRACTSCGCAPTVACTASTRFFSNVSCGGSSVDVANDGACHSTNGERHSHSGSISNGSCTVTQQAELTGSLDLLPDATATLCCSE